MAATSSAGVLRRALTGDVGLAHNPDEPLVVNHRQAPHVVLAQLLERL